MGPIEKEFDPTIYTAEYVVVEHDEPLPPILERVADALTRTPNVVLIIPRGAQAFHTTQDFLALGKLQWANEVRVAVASLDPTIAGLARVLGFHIVDPPADHPAFAGDPSLDNSNTPVEGSEGEKPTAPLPLGGLPGMPEWVIAPSVPVYTPTSTSGNLTTSAWLNMPGEGMASRSKPGSSSRSGMPPPRTKPRQTGVLLPTTITDTSLPALPDGEAQGGAAVAEENKARRVLTGAQPYQKQRGWRYNSGVRSVRWARIFSAIVVVLVLALVAGSTYAYMYLPEGSVSVKPTNRSYSAVPVEVVVITQPGAPVDPSSNTPEERGSVDPTVQSGASITALGIEAPLSVEGTRPSSGSRQVARGRAAGTMRFANNSGSPRSVPAGAQFKAANGVTVETTQGGTVPATNLLQQVVGVLDLPIAATVEGPDGNMGSGQVQGTYGGVLTYSNITPLQGGSVETLKVVTQEDIDALTNDLNAQIESQVGSAILSKVAPGQQLITQTITLQDKQVTTDHKGGEDAEAVRATITAKATASAYDESKMSDSVTQAVYEWVSRNVPTQFGPVTDLHSIEFTAPMVQSLDNGRATYGTSASARVNFTLTPQMSQQIRQLVKGQSVEQARQLISQQYANYLSVGPIRANVLWFNVDKLPNDPARIVVALGDSPVYVPPTQP